MVWGAVIGSVAGGAASGLINKLLNDNDSQTIQQQPIETSEQAEARRILLDLSREGRLGDLNLGEDLGLSPSNFELSDIERQAIQSTIGRANAGISPALQDSLNALSSFLEDPSIDPSGQFNPFKQRVERELQDRTDALKRNAAFTGNLFSTSLLDDISDVQSRGQESLSSELARLTNESLNRKFQAASTIPSISALINEIDRQNVSDLFGVGGIERTLANQRIAEQNAEVLRQRDEKLKRIDALSSVLGSPVTFGVPSITVSQPGPFSGVFNQTGAVIGNALTNYLNNRSANNQRTNTSNPGVYDNTLDFGGQYGYGIA